MRYAFASLVLVAACSPSAGPSPVAAPVVVAVASDAGPSPLAEEGTDPTTRGTAPPRTLLEDTLEQWGPSLCPSSYDYFPNGGIQSFWCHRPVRLTLAAVRAMAGVDIFASGPHTADALTLDAPADFGHYNPAFVRWLVENVTPSPHGSPGQQLTQPIYDAKVKPLAEVFWKTYDKARSEAACFAREKKAYADAIARNKLPPGYVERWFFFMNPYFCEKGALGPSSTFYFDNGFDAGVNGNVTKTVVGFWLRRSIDGTMETFAEGLKHLVSAYDPELLATPYQRVQTSPLTRALDDGVRASTRCKDPRAPVPIGYVDVHVFPDGHVEAHVKTRPVQGSPQATCVEAAFANRQLPPFSGEPLHFSRPVNLR